MFLQFILTFIVFDYVNGDNTKGSLTFVIDETWSMSDDIDQVKEQTNQVFDAVLSSNASRIDDFIIVTFDDPDARLYTITRDPREFKKALAAIRVHGNYDCPEYAMKGIELALKHSKPNSFFYVFTDAAAKDYKEYDRIRSLGLKKSIQVTFLLTGTCSNSPWEANAVYDKLAAATNGQVFHLEKQDIRKIMHYIIASVNHIKTTIAHKVFDNNLNKKFQFSIDSKVWDVIISVSGVMPRYHITDPDGNTVAENIFIKTEKSHISKLEAKPGVYTMYLDSTGPTSVAITGSTYVTFQHGFSTVKPTTLNETSTKPISGLPTYLSIALENINKDVSLDTVEIRDINDNIISEFPLTLIDTNQQFYVTKPFLTPTSPFKVAINGHTKSKEKITRVASTTIEPQKPELEGPKPKKPIVIILEGDKITGEYDKQMTLKCKVNAYPKPDVIWQDNFETLYSSMIVPVDLPYEYMSILKIEKVNKNVTVQCKAVNVLGEDSKYIAVETKRNYFIKVLGFSKDTTIEYGTPAELHFKVNAFPLVNIKWYKNGKQIKNNSDYEVSSDGSRVKIKQMRNELKGNYTVEAYNDVEIKQHEFKLDMSGVVPVIDKRISEYEATKGFNVNISCRILKSKPTPVISWTFKAEGLENSIHLRETTETLYLNNVGLEHVGIYYCVAQNEFGRDSHVVDLHVVYPPTIQKVKTQIQLPKGELVILTCKVDGSPFPIVRWFFNKVAIENTGRYTYSDNSLSFIGSVEDNGIYTCKASNALGDAKKDFYVNIYIVPVIDKSISEYEARKGFNVNISCRILKSKPTPVISWTFKAEGLENSIHLRETTETLYLNNVGLEHVGIYYCVAQNEFGRDSHVVDLHVVYPPTIQKVKTQIQLPKGELVILTCKVDGSPFPIVRWFFNKVAIENTGRYTYSDNTLSFIGSVEDNGIYTCKASNALGDAKKDFYVNIYIVPVIDKSISEYEARKGFNVNISCRILKSTPTPVISWTFKPEGLNIRIPLRETTETLHLNNVGLEHLGIYSCAAQNEFGRDSNEINLNVVYPPTIQKVKTHVQLPKGELVILTCKVEGFPFPIVRWFFNKVAIENTRKYFFNVNSLSFIGSVEDNGIYTCKASNALGDAKKDFYVNIFIPIKMTEPKNSTLELTVGDSVHLLCQVEGYPKPKVQWTFHSENSSIPLKLLRADSTGSLSVEHVQVEDEGLYRCDARNVGGLKSITYKIQVKEPVSILANPLGVTTYDAVKGDLALRIPCKAKGNPKPGVTWETKGYNIASGTDWFDIEEDGTLVIKHPTLNSAGSYTCRASNAFSSNLLEFTVNVTPYPQLDYVSETLNFESGTSHHVECGIPHGYGDNVNWFKNGQLIARGELNIRNITIEDSGVYSCRVSTFLSAHTIHKEVIVGYKPYFKSEEDNDMNFIEGTFAYLDCSAYGAPEPQIIWRHNGNIMNTSDMGMNYIIEMTPDVIGSYECIVSNKFGNITRTFNIKYAKECFLNIENDFNIYQPLLLSQSQQWPDFKKINDFLRIPKSTDLLFACPGNTVTYNGEEFGEYVKATCIDNSIFKIRDRNVDFSKLKCIEEIKSLAKRTYQSCFTGNTELLNVGFYLKSHLLRVYDVCIDKDNNIPLYTRHNLHQGYTGSLPKQDLTFTESIYLPFAFEDMYKCSLQLQSIYSVMDIKLNSPNKCCFKRRQLVSPADVIPGLSQVATYNYLNVIPQWSSCGSENWDEIERRIRSLVKFSDINLSVFTGSSYSMRLPGQTSPVFLRDRFKSLQRVPMYIWKVIQNTQDGSSLAIVQFNVPNTTLSEALSSMLCEDICGEVEWMKNDQWHSVEKGFTFCCSITEFSKYYGTLIKGHDKVFKTLPLVSEHSLI